MIRSWIRAWSVFLQLKREESKGKREGRRGVASHLELKLTFVCFSRSPSLSNLLSPSDSLLLALTLARIPRSQVGPIPVGLNSFEFSASPPTLSLLPSPSTPADLIGVTVIILSASYNDAEFVRVGYYVATNWDSEEYALDVEEGRKDGEMEHLVRNVKVDTPRVTRFSNKW